MSNSKNTCLCTQTHFCYAVCACTLLVLSMCCALRLSKSAVQWSGFPLYKNRDLAPIWAANGKQRKHIIQSVSPNTMCFSFGLRVVTPPPSTQTHTHPPTHTKTIHKPPNIYPKGLSPWACILFYICAKIIPNWEDDLVGYNACKDACKISLSYKLLMVVFNNGPSTH